MYQSNISWWLLSLKQKSLSGCDDKCNVCQVKITKLLFGLEQLRDDKFGRQITCNMEWGSIDDSDNKVLAESSMEQSTPPTQYTPKAELVFWSASDPVSANDHTAMTSIGLFSEQEDNSDHDRCLFKNE